MKKVLLLLVLSFSFSFIFAQKNVIDKIVAIVGDEIILQSDIVMPFYNNRARGSSPRHLIIKQKFWNNNWYRNYLWPKLK